jgi:signal transduction histidine kinase
MKFAAYIWLVGCVWNFLLALFVLWNGVRSTAHRVYFFLGTAIAVWNLGGYFLFTIPANDPDMALFWARITWIGVIFIPVLLFHLSFEIAGLPPWKRLWVFYVIAAVLAVFDWTPYFLSSVKHLGSSGWYAQPGPVFHAFNIVFALVFISIYVLIQRRKELPPHSRRQFDALIFAQSCLILLGMNDLLPFMGLEKYPGTHTTVYPYGSLAAVVYGIILAYSVLQRQLLNVRIHLSRIAAQIIRFVFLFFIGLILLITATLIIPGPFGVYPFFAGLAVLMISSILASLMFPRLFGTGGETLERRILGDRFEYHDQVRQFIDSTSWYSDLPALFDDLHELLTATFRVRSYHVIFREETSRALSLFRAHPELPQRSMPELRIPSPLFQFFEWGKSEYLSLNAAHLRAENESLEGQASRQLAAFNAEFCFPLSSQNEPFGLLLVGEKTTGAPFTATDINLLVALVKSMSLVINQIRLKTQILQAEELDLLGRMSRGMAHDLNNLLTPISTLLQLACEGIPPQAMEELLPVAMRNVRAMRAYIKESLFFSENLRPDIQLGRLDVLVARASEVARNSRNKVVNILTDCPGEVLVEMDEVLIQRMLANLISNAIDASAVDAVIRVELLRLVKNDAGRDWLRIRIVDEGEGIRKEDLNRVFTPYFTTKDRGDEGRGFGLGLAICRKIVNLHGGNLSIASQHKKGTTVQVDLPSRQVRQASPPVAA